MKPLNWTTRSLKRSLIPPQKIPRRNNPGKGAKDRRREEATLRPQQKMEGRLREVARERHSRSEAAAEEGLLQILRLLHAGHLRPAAPLSAPPHVRAQPRLLQKVPPHRPRRHCPLPHPRRTSERTVPGLLWNQSDFYKQGRCYSWMHGC